MTHRFTDLELLWTVPYGRAAGVGDLTARPPGTLRSAVEDAVLPALHRPPCVVSFSGGRDSSTVLAVATALARREGLALPVPVTNTFPAVPASHEGRWQELVVRHLDLPEWTRLEFTDELDVAGPVARDTLRRLGVRAPFNLHFHAPIAALAAGGSLLTGVGGDELFSPVARLTPYRLLSRRWDVNRRTVRDAALDLAPRPLRVRRSSRRIDLPYGWVRPAALRRLRTDLARLDATEPLSWERAVRRRVWPGRRLQMHREGLDRLGALHGVAVENPFCAPGVLATTATAWGRPGPRGRTRELRAQFGDLLPADLLERSTKSSFNAAFWAGPAREWARGWSGDGLGGDLADLVDVEGLHQEWSGAEPDPHSFSLLHTALLASLTRSAPQR
ncbi:asparagine synthase-related protein [Kineococcus sp. SYSU DK001]|uniref:asparagine synthase-related protein n=1 Tax=Kineococcus sp. SYSU DK001 TaxID=3383122 RepID=UPI003D7CDA16